MKILFVLEHFYPYIGGVEFLFWQLTKKLNQQGHSVKVITTLYDKSLLRTETIDGVEIERINCKNRFLFTIKSILPIYRDAPNFDLIHTSTYNAAIAAWVAAKLRRKKCILTFHEYWGKLWYRLPFLNPIQKLSYRFFEAMITKLPFHQIIAVSDHTRSALMKTGIPKHKITRIYNGLDYKHIESLIMGDVNVDQQEDHSHSANPKKIKSFIFISRLGVSKGLDLILPASEIILAKYPEYRCKLVLPTTPKTLYLKVLKTIKRLNQNSRIDLMHNLSKSQLYHKIKTSEFIVIPSYSEGFCFMAAESVAMGIPIVSSQMAALKEVVSGKYIPMETLSVKGLTNAMEKAIQDQWLYKKPKYFRIEESVKQHIKLYESICYERTV